MLTTKSTASQLPKCCSEESVVIDGRRVRFWRAGLGDTVVLVHGLLGYSFSWRKAIPVVAKAREVIALDMLGSGFSDCDSQLDGRLSSAADRLKQFLDAIGIPRCDLVGSSYGGAMAVVLAALDPSRIRRLVLVSPANPWSQFGKKRLALLRMSPIRALFPLVARGSRPLHNYFLRRLYGDPARITAESYEGYSDPLKRGGRLEHATKIVQSWHSDMLELEASLKKISHVPTLLIWGSKDKAVDPDSAEPLSRNFRTVRVEFMQGAGHLPYEEQPEEFCRIVSEFLADPVSSAAREVT